MVAARSTNTKWTPQNNKATPTRNRRRSIVQSLISSLPTTWTDLLDRPEPVAPATEEAIALSFLPARLALAAIEKFTATEPDAADRPEPYSPEAPPDYWAMDLPQTPVPESVNLSPLPSSTPDHWAMAAQPIPPIHCQLLLPAAREVAVPEKLEPTNAQEKAIALEYETGPFTIVELCDKYQMSARNLTDICREYLGRDRYAVAITRKRQARLQATSKPEPYRNRPSSNGQEQLPHGCNRMERPQTSTDLTEF